MTLWSAPSDLHDVVAELLRIGLEHEGTLPSRPSGQASSDVPSAHGSPGEALLLVQALRATGGDGSHVTVEDAVCAQFNGHVDVFTKAIFERFRQGRHAAQYFDPSKADKTKRDAEWALATADRALHQTAALIDQGAIELY